jgi:hypothetical protein
MDARRNGSLGTADTLGPWWGGGVYRPVCGMDTVSTPAAATARIDTPGTRTSRPGGFRCLPRDLLVGTVSALAALGVTAGLALSWSAPAPDPIVRPGPAAAEHCDDAARTIFGRVVTARHGSLNVPVSVELRTAPVCRAVVGAAPEAAQPVPIAR